MADVLHSTWGNVPPTHIPPAYNAHYVNFVTGYIYQAKGTTSSSDWVLIYPQISSIVERNVVNVFASRDFEQDDFGKYLLVSGGCDETYLTLLSESLDSAVYPDNCRIDISVAYSNSYGAYIVSSNGVYIAAQSTYVKPGDKVYLKRVAPDSWVLVREDTIHYEKVMDVFSNIELQQEHIGSFLVTSGGCSAIGITIKEESSYGSYPDSAYVWIKGFNNPFNSYSVFIDVESGVNVDGSSSTTYIPNNGFAILKRIATNSWVLIHLGGVVEETQHFSVVERVYSSMTMYPSDVGKYFKVYAPCSTVNMHLVDEYTLGEYYPDNSEIHIRVAVGATSGDACMVTYDSGVTIEYPFGSISGSLSSGMAITLKRIGINEWDVIGQTN